MPELDVGHRPVLVGRPVVEGPGDDADAALLRDRPGAVGAEESKTTTSSHQDRQSRQAPMLISSLRVRMRTETLTIHHYKARHQIVVFTAYHFGFTKKS